MKRIIIFILVLLVFATCLTIPTIYADLLVSSINTDNILRYNETTGEFIDEFVTAGSGGLNKPMGLDFGPDNNLYVSSFNTDNILRYNGTTGAFIDEFVTVGSGGLKDPRDMVFGPDNNLYVSSEFNDNILRYNGTTGVFIDEFVTAGSGGLDHPEGLVFGPDSNLYVSSVNTDNILRYNSTTGEFIDEFVTAGSGGLRGPEGLGFGPDNNLYVSSTHTSNVLRYDGTTGAFIDIFATGGGLIGPIGLDFGPDNNLYVNNSSGVNNVLRYNGTTGEFIDEFVSASSGGLVGPMFLTFTSTAVSEPNINISPTHYDFGSINIGIISTPQTFSISNTGDVDLTLGTIALTGIDPTEFAIQNDYCSAQIIAPSGNCTINAVFAPTLDGAKGANLSIPSDDPDTPTLDVPLSGVGLPTNGTISGFVIDPSHNPVPDARVLFWKNGVKTEIRTDANGWYIFTGLADGTYNIVARKDGFKDTKKAKIKQSKPWGLNEYIILVLP